MVDHPTAAERARALITVTEDRGTWTTWLAFNGGKIALTSRHGPGTREIAEAIGGSWVTGLAEIITDAERAAYERAAGVCEATALHYEQRSRDAARAGENRDVDHYDACSEGALSASHAVEALAGGETKP